MGRKKTWKVVYQLWNNTYLGRKLEKQEIRGETEFYGSACGSMRYYYHRLLFWYPRDLLWDDSGNVIEFWADNSKYHNIEPGFTLRYYVTDDEVDEYELDYNAWDYDEFP